MRLSPILYRRIGGTRWVRWSVFTPAAPFPVPFFAGTNFRLGRPQSQRPTLFFPNRPDAALNTRSGREGSLYTAALANFADMTPTCIPSFLYSIALNLYTNPILVQHRHLYRLGSDGPVGENHPDFFFSSMS